MKFRFWCAGILAALVVGGAFAVPSVTVDRVQQRYPWNGLVDIDYTVSDLSGDAADWSVVLQATADGAAVSSLTFVGFAPCDLPSTEGSHRVTWNAAADLLDGAHAVSVTATLAYAHVALQDADYVIIDLSSGVGGTYPVRAVRAPGLATSAFNQMPYKTEKMVFKRVPKGGFWMGSPTTDKDGAANTRPYHYVAFRNDFFLAVFETTIGQYERSVGKWTGTNHKSDERNWAAIRTNRTRVQSILAALRTGSGLGALTLPTEAQWEYACRAGTITRYFWGDTTTGSGTYAWTSENSGAKDRGVGQRQPNPWGFYDIAGNLYEACSDFYAASYSDTGTEEEPTYDPTGPEQPASSPKTVVRGGSGGNFVTSCKSYFRGNAAYPNGSYNNDGFRAAISLADTGDTSSEHTDSFVSAAVVATVDVSSSAVRVLTSVSALCPLAWTSSAAWAEGGDGEASADLVLETMVGDAETDPSGWSADASQKLVDADAGEGTVAWPAVGKRLYRLTLAIDGAAVETAYFNLQGATGTSAGKDIALCDIQIETSGYSATGYPVEPRLTVSDENVQLVQGRDYAVTLSDAIRPGTPRVSIVGLGAYDGCAVRTITISPYVAEKVAEDLSDSLGGDFRPGAVLPFETTNDFFRVAWSSAADWRTGGAAGATATVTAMKMQGVPEADPSTWTESGESTTPVLAATGEGTAYWMPTSADLYRLTLAVDGQQTAVAYLDFTADEEFMTGTPIASCVIDVQVEPLPCTGYPQMPSVTITSGGVTLVEGVDYELTATGNVNPGEAMVTIIGLGDYSGRVKLPFTIGPLPAQQVVAADEMGGAFADVRTNALKYASWKALPPVTYNDVNPVGDSVPWPAGGSNVAGAEARILAAPIVGETAGEFTVQKDSLVGEGTVRLRLPAGQWRLRLETGSNGTWSGTALTVDVDILNNPGMLFLLR